LFVCLVENWVVCYGDAISIAVMVLSNMIGEPVSLRNCTWIVCCPMLKESVRNSMCPGIRNVPLLGGPIEHLYVLLLRLLSTTILTQIDAGESNECVLEN